MRLGKGLDMDIATHINDHILKEPNTLQSTPRHKLFPDVAQVFGDNIHSILYKSPKINKTITPQSNPKVKRNLNDSFNETPKSVNTTTSPHLNYSLIEDNDASLVLKLRLSKSQPYVHLKRSTEIIRRLAEPPQYNRSATKTRRISFADECLTSAKKNGRTRKSSRAIGRKPYAEFLSPEKIPEDHERDSIKSPQKRLRSKSVDGYEYSTKSPNNNAKFINTVNDTSSTSKRLRPRRSSVTQRSYKEVFTENDDSDLEGSGSSCPSPAKRTRPKRTIKLPVRYTELSDEIIDGVEELALSDDERKSSTSSPKKKAISYVDTTLRKNKGQLDVEDEKWKLHATNKDNTSKLSSTVNTTPKSHLQRSTQKMVTNSLKLMRSGVLTPSVQSRATPVKAASTPLNKARLALHVAHVPDALPCREKEAADVYGFVEGKLLDGCGGCMYISGVPGTGKTATVTFVVRQLQKQSQNGELPKFDYVSVNGMRLTEPRQSYVEILKQLTGKIVPWEQAQNQLNSKFTKKGQKATNPIVLLIDELDILCTKRQDVVYNLLDWPSKAFCQLIIVTIANTMDLPERLLMGRVTSRLGLTRLTFQAYNHKQLREIVTKRLHDSKTFNPDAIELVARKVASVSGDARRALDICRRAAEMAEEDGLISMTHVNEALDSMMTQPKIRAIKSSSRLQKLLLQSVVAEIERTGVEETTFSAVFKIFSSVAAIDGFAMVSMTMAMTAVAKLGACRLLLLDPKISGLYHRIMLNVSVDDVYYALKSD